MLAWFLCIFAVFAADPDVVAALEVDGVRPEAIAGRSLRLDVLMGPGVRGSLLYFYGAGCDDCAALVPALSDLHERFEAQGIRVVAVAMGAPERVEGAFPVVRDAGPLAETLGVSSAPTLILLHRDFSVVRTEIGTPPADVMADLEAALEHMAASGPRAPPPPPVAPPNPDFALASSWMDRTGGLHLRFTEPLRDGQPLHEQVLVRKNPQLSYDIRGDEITVWGNPPFQDGVTVDVHAVLDVDGHPLPRPLTVYVEAPRWMISLHRLPPLSVWLTLGLFLGVALLLSFLPERHELAPPRDDDPHPAWLAGIVLLAAVLRFVDAPASIANVNSHGLEYLRMSMQGMWTEWAAYNNGYYWFFNLFYAAGAPRVGETVMHVNAGLGVLSVLALYALVAVLFQDRTAALVAAGIWAAWPPHVRFSHTEDFVALASSMHILVMLGAVLAGRRPGWRSFMGAACLLSFAVQVRPTLWLLPVPALGLFVATARREGVTRTVRHPAFWVVSAGLAAVLASSLRSMLQLLSDPDGAQGSVLDPFGRDAWINAFFSPTGTPFGVGNVTFNPHYTSPLVLACLVAGLWWVGRNRPGVAATLLVTYVPFALVGSSFQMGIVPTLRLQMAHQWIPVVTAGAGGAWLLRSFELPRWAPPAVVTAALVAVYLPYRSWVRTDYATQLEYRFQTEAFAHIPDGCTVVRQDVNVGGINTALAEWIPANAGKHVRFEEASNFLARGGPAPGECAVWYRGISCFTFEARDNSGFDAQPLCLKMDRQPFERVLDARDIPARRPGSLRYRADPVPLELRLLTSGTGR